MFIYTGNNQVPKDVKTVIIDNNSVSYIKGGAFQHCTEITIITIPSNVTYIGDNAFEGCTSLISVNLPSTLTYLGDHAFQGCKALLYINIPPSVTFVGDHAFHSCDELLSNISNYRNIFGLLKDRFKNLPLHQVCSSENVSCEDIEATIQRLQHQDNHVGEQNFDIDDTDAWEFSPLHVLCCNSYVTSDMIQSVLQYMGQHITILTTSNGMTALQLYMTCKKGLNYDLSLCLALKLGMKWKDVMKMIAVDGLNTLEQGMIDESFMFPFMLAAIHPSCDLECLYNLSMYNVNNLEPLPS